MPEIRTLNGYDLEDTKARNSIEEITTKKYLFIGDSYMAHDNNIVDPCAAVLGLNSSEYFKYAAGGFGFVAQLGTFLSLLNTAISEIEDKDSIKEIIVCGGLNDIAQSDENITNAIQTFVTTAKASFTNAIIKIGFAGWWRSADHIGAQTGRVAMQYKKAAINSGAFWLHGTEYAMHDYRMFATDNIHPKDASVYNWLGKCLAQAIQTGKCSINFVNYDRALTPSNDFTIVSSRAFTVDEIVEDGITTFTLANDFQMTSTNGVQISFNTALLLGTLNDGLVMGSVGRFNNSWIPVNFICGVKNDNSTHSFNGYLYITNNQLYVVPTSPEISSISSTVKISSLLLSRFTLAMPTPYC